MRTSWGVSRLPGSPSWRLSSLPHSLTGRREGERNEGIEHDTCRELERLLSDRRDRRAGGREGGVVGTDRLQETHRLSHSLEGIPFREINGEAEGKTVEPPIFMRDTYVNALPCVRRGFGETRSDTTVGKWRHFVYFSVR